MTTPRTPDRSTNSTVTTNASTMLPIRPAELPVSSCTIRPSPVIWSWRYGSSERIATSAATTPSGLLPKRSDRKSAWVR